MAAASIYMANAILNWAFRGVSYTPVQQYVALYTVLPTSSGGGTEVSGGSYARVGIGAPSTSIFSAPATVSGAQQITNSNILNFGTATAGWGTIVGFGLLDASTSGNLLFFGSLAANKTVNSGDAFQFPVGQLQINFS